MREYIILKGDKEAVIYGCSRILLYTPGEIRLRAGNRPLSVIGGDLCCSSFSGGTATITGKIEAVRYDFPETDG